jgi:N-methylhydantoinase A
MKIRIGIDVGGTFTDAVAIDDSNYDIIGTMKIPTTHDGTAGVATGVMQVIRKIMEKYKIKQEDVVFIAYGTTQATNALLEGDVTTVGIIGMGCGLEGIKVKSDTQVGDVELAPRRYLKTFHRYVDIGKDNSLERYIDQLKAEGCQAIVASAAFAVDDPSTEELVIAKAIEAGLLATGSHEISKLYGLKIRTRTAVINASILPKMVETADITERSVRQAGIEVPLMIMRCDGGVMDIDAIRKRPILTMLSGPAAGVAGALMYEKVSDGIFLEVGGTSTDISAIRNGKVMISYAEVGGHKTYLSSLDIRTVGIGGGSMIRIDDGGVVDVGPRSAHIAGLAYAVYASPEDIVAPQIVLVQPKAGDPANYAAIRCENGKAYAITLSCAANILGQSKPGDYAHGCKEAAYKAFMPFAEKYNTTVEAIAKRIMEFAAIKNAAVVEKLIADYKFELSDIILVGGGGGAAAVVPFLGQQMGIAHKIAKNAEVISPIGVALAMVREVVERTIDKPTGDDILRVRREAEQAAIHSGAALGTIELNVEIDALRSIVRVIATGATELRTKDRVQKRLSEAELVQIAAMSMGLEASGIEIIGTTGDLYILRGKTIVKRLFGLVKNVRYPIRVVDSEGVIRIQKSCGEVFKISITNFEQELDQRIEQGTVYSDGGRQLPTVFLFYGKKVIDFSGLIHKEQIISVAKLEVSGLGDDDVLYALIGGKDTEGRYLF